ncbi:SH3 domain-containing protein [Gracilibacillus oryzae]|uniref:SH3 domain-containing protein n=1 Tax=Gracilibacillus oryzae TaxID=1672701 RepID=A0A7C8GQZ6_9BACI|nr:N-acetylmuramoyl-L-alanine amidase [Gracilibacillus oryzae]KAB8127315.1 SH3 domain-containing protein [Gracilibacillus oryzae]
MRKKVLVISLFSMLLILSMSLIIYAKDAYIDGDNLNVRSGPGTEYEVIGQVHPPDVYPILEENEEWLKIDYQNQQGWIAREFVTIKESTEAQKATEKNREKRVFPAIIPNGLAGKVVVIDPGHGGRDVGAISVSEEFESTYTLHTAKVLAEMLTAHGAIVHMTREDDRYITLFSRSTYANTVHADVFLSLHYNSIPEYPNVSGASTFYYNDRDQKLAELVQDGIITETGMNDRGIKQEDLQVLRTNHRPGLLLEIGFISNQEEEEHNHARVFIEATSRGIVTGLEQYFHNQ